MTEEREQQWIASTAGITIVVQGKTREEAERNAREKLAKEADSLVVRPLRATVDEA